MWPTQREEQNFKWRESKHKSPEAEACLQPSVGAAGEPGKGDRGGVTEETGQMSWGLKGQDKDFSPGLDERSF